MPASHREKNFGNTSMPKPTPVAHAPYLYFIWFSKTALVYSLIVLAELTQLHVSSQSDYYRSLDFLPFLTGKVSPVTFSEGDYTLSWSQNDKTSNIW